MKERARPLVLAAPSGSGKTTIARRLVAECDDFVFSVSATTREPRPGERDGIDYEFVDRETFEEMIARNELVEWAEVHGRLYGTTHRALDEAAVSGKHVVLDIDVQGAAQIRRRVSDAVLVFVLPPSVEELLARLGSRATEKPRELERRLRNALGEFEQAGSFDYVVVNDDLDLAVARVRDLARGTAGAARPADMEGDVARLREELGRVLAERFASTA